MAVDGAGLALLIDLARESAGAARAGRIPTAGEIGPQRTLTVGMSTYDDFDGAYFTIMGLRLYHPEVADRISILVIDNNPYGRDAWALKHLEETIPGVRYVPVADVQGTAVRSRVFDEANSDWVLCVDSHIQLLPGALAKLVEFIDAHPDCADLLQGPMLDDSLRNVSTHWEPRWSAGMFGEWATDPRGVDAEAPPFEIGMQGLGVFGCRKDAWLGFNPLFRGHGGEEGYIHEKFRAAGRRTLCLPFLRWTHRFARPAGVSFRLSYADRIRNYLIGWQELGLAVEPILDHFRQQAGDPVVEDVVARLQTERTSPFTFFGAIMCLNLDRQPERWASMLNRCEQFGIAGLVRRIPVVDTPEDHHIGCALSHRRALELARRENLDSVLVIEDDAVFLHGAVWVLRRGVRELANQAWNLFYLGAFDSRPFPLVHGCTYLEAVRGVTTTHALAYHHRIYDRLLAELPDDVVGMRAWLNSNNSIDKYLANTVTTGAHRVRPQIAAQAGLLRYVDVDLRDQFAVDPVARSAAAPIADEVLFFPAGQGRIQVPAPPQLEAEAEGVLCVGARDGTRSRV
jgi:hypothetical protein